MKFKTLSLAALFALATVPAASYAQTGSGAALDACVRSFVQTYLPGHPVHKITKNSPASSLIEHLYRRSEYTIVLSARGVRTGDVLAEARCVANRSGTVIVLDQPSVAQLRSLRPDFVVSMR